MEIIKGNYNSCKIFATIIDDQTRNQIYNLLNQKFIKHCKVRIMPDCHAGKGCVIGTTIKIKNKVVPNLVGVDIGCGILCVKLNNINIDYCLLDNFIKENIPSGMNVNDSVTNNDIDLSKLKCFNSLKKVDYLNKSIASLGGGNHFIEIDEDEDNNKYLIIHSGSRNLGTQVCNIYQKMAIKNKRKQMFDKEKAKIIKHCKKIEINEKLEEIKNVVNKFLIDEELTYLEKKDFKDYMHDMNICQKFAMKNREMIARRILSFLNLNYDSLFHFETIHNYINMKDKILRKGAISAYKSEIVLIPINMKDGCIIAKGKSKKDYNYSAPHGAGRIMSRAEAFKNISLEDYKEAMKGIYSTTIVEKTKDESPFVYKPLSAIIDNIKDTVDIIKIIKPKYNFKSE